MLNNFISCKVKSQTNKQRQSKQKINLPFCLFLRWQYEQQLNISWFQQSLKTNQLLTFSLDIFRKIQIMLDLIAKELLVIQFSNKKNPSEKTVLYNQYYLQSIHLYILQKIKISLLVKDYVCGSILNLFLRFNNLHKFCLTQLKLFNQQIQFELMYLTDQMIEAFTSTFNQEYKPIKNKIQQQNLQDILKLEIQQDNHTIIMRKNYSTCTQELSYAQLFKISKQVQIKNNVKLVFNNLQ
ncbi:hypothetical protein TTHERM_000630738 (macronuclear) [Tetrahymena thermophila SB210]|uniref:Uncharacterized protein n=1 Tax=Tetrahymena thermophila (strain SB210) TaxID=312017 RepID=W7X800_TETTS|nr:hypothetical protein TTHERM_000630738 [Tetrahymena thermophila SB210]EWS72553.1 hypothetical protein TTHERM_000630738 [Tetrahymena thermophila SB210]|eukprot:XP_012654836.1 hypothetical protein TTHERM_000630738 [Tetrahymena thermophila SB210]